MAESETPYQSLTGHLPSAISDTFLVEPDVFLELIGHPEGTVLVVHTKITTLSLKGIQSANMYTMRHEGFVFRTGTKEPIEFPPQVRLVEVQETA